MRPLSYSKAVKIQKKLQTIDHALSSDSEGSKSQLPQLKTQTTVNVETSTDEEPVQTGYHLQAAD